MLKLLFFKIDPSLIQVVLPNFLQIMFQPNQPNFNLINPKAAQKKNTLQNHSRRRGEGKGRLVGVGMIMITDSIVFS